MEMVEEKSDYGDSDISEVKNIAEKCSKACMECLSCPHNTNSNFNLILQRFFNSGKNLDDIKGIDVNLGCELRQ